MEATAPRRTLIDPLLRKVLTSTISGGAGWFLAALGPLVSTPIMLDHLGEHRYGLWMMLTSITALIGLSDFGITNGITSRLSQQGIDRCERRALIGNAYLILLLASLGLAGMLGLTMLLVRLAGLQGDDPMLWPTVLVVLTPTIMTIPLGFIQRLLYVDMRGGEASLAPGISSMLSVAVAIIGARLGLDAYTLMFCFLISNPIVYGLMTLRYFAANPDLLPTPAVWAADLAGKILRSGLPYVPLSLLVILCNKFDYMIIAHFQGVTNVVPYAIADRIIGIANATVTILSVSLWPAISRQIAEGNRRWIFSSILKLNGAVILCYLILIAALLAFYDQLVLMWLGKPMATSYSLLVFLCLSSMTIALTSPYFALANSLGMIKEQIYAYLLLLLVSLPLKIAAGVWFGSSGVAAGGFLSWLLVMLPSIVIITTKRLNREIP